MAMVNMIDVSHIVECMQWSEANLTEDDFHKIYRNKANGNRMYKKWVASGRSIYKLIMNGNRQEKMLMCIYISEQVNEMVNNNGT